MQVVLVFISHMSSFDSKYFFHAEDISGQHLKNFCSCLFILYRLVLKYLRCVCEVAWSAVCLHSKPVLSCIDFTVSLCQFSGLSVSKSKDKITKCFGYKPNLPSCPTCNKAAAVPLQRQWWQQWCCHHLESFQRFPFFFLLALWSICKFSLSSEHWGGIQAESVRFSSNRLAVKRREIE